MAEGPGADPLGPPPCSRRGHASHVRVQPTTKSSRSSMAAHPWAVGLFQQEPLALGHPVGLAKPFLDCSSPISSPSLPCHRARLLPPQVWSLYPSQGLPSKTSSVFTPILTSVSRRTQTNTMN